MRTKDRESLSGIASKLISTAQAAYPDGEDFIQPDAEGDGLAKFIYHELMDACVEAESAQEAAMQAIGMMERAARELDAVQEAMEDLASEPSS